MAGSSKRVSSQYIFFLALIFPLLLACAGADGTSDTIVVSKVKQPITTGSSIGELLDDSSSSCELVEECKLCDANLRTDIPECAVSGRVEIRHCTVASAGAGTHPLYRSCKRTKADEEFLMIRLQVLWVVIGTAAFVSARKQKAVSASLFDQRKLAAAAAQENAKRRRRDSSNNTADVEMVQMQMEETIPLTASADTVDVVV